MVLSKLGINQVFFIIEPMQSSVKSHILYPARWELSPSADAQDRE